MHVSGNHRYGTVEMDQILRNYCVNFEPLLEAAYFRKVKVDQVLGTILWPNGDDVCPDDLNPFTTRKINIVTGEVLL